MSLENLCVSLETAKKLHEAGIRVESCFYWWECSWGNHQNTEWHLGTKYDSDLQKMNWAWLECSFPAPTAEELWKLIPYSFSSDKIKYNDRGRLKFYIDPIETYYPDVDKKLVAANVVAWHTYLARLDTDEYKMKESSNLHLCEALADMLLWLNEKGYLK